MQFAIGQQSGKTHRIAIVDPTLPIVEIVESGHPFYRAFFKELRRLGYIEGQNLVVSRYTAEGHEARFAAIAHEAVAQKPDMIWAPTSRLVLRLKEATSTIPIVGVTSDPVAWGIVSNLARPGGNITGVSSDAGLEIWAKRLALLKEAVPHLSKVGFLATQLVWDSPSRKAVINAAAKDLALQLIGPPLLSVTKKEFERVFAEWSQHGVDGVILSDQAELSTSANAQIVANLAKTAHLPLVSSFRVTSEHGGLMAYAHDQDEVATQNARQIDEIVKGAKPGDIPIYQATRFLLIINLKAAKAFGLAIPPSLLSRADEVIE
jgi:putative ABC transport system substrate-binding protein